MNTSEPIGNPAWGAFFVRVAVGCFFVLKGLHELNNLPIAVQGVGFLKNVPPHLLTLFGFLIPYLEILFGALLVVGFWTIIGAVGTSLIALLFVYVVGVFTGGSAKVLNKDLIVLAGALSLLYTGAGAFSVDKFRKS
jgi:uncharacterized membrane protein YphA (DoxX/SURF4 family)